MNSTVDAVDPAVESILDSIFPSVPASVAPAVSRLAALENEVKEIDFHVSSMRHNLINSIDLYERLARLRDMDQGDVDQIRIVSAMARAGLEVDMNLDSWREAVEAQDEVSMKLADAAGEE